jgi:uncharacterized protein (TIGR02001 family)
MNLNRHPDVLVAMAAAGLLVPAAGAAAADAPHAFSGQAAIYSEYEYRGIDQTSGDPALQLTLDYSHASGLYAGTFLSNVKWLEDTGDVLGMPTDAKLEWDLYGGYRWSFAPGWKADVGLLRYQYPSSTSFEPSLGSPNTTEAYVGVQWGPATLKYSYALTKIFGVPDSEGSDYLELSAKYPVSDKLSLTGLLGRQRYRGSQPVGSTQFDNGNFDYTVWKAGAVYDFGNGLSVGAYYKGTDADPAYFTFKGEDWSRDRAVAFAAYAF